MDSKRQYVGNLTSPEFEEGIRTKRGVMVVCGSCEQHGRHLPLDTDNIIGMEVAARVAERTGMLLMPPVNYGQVWSAKGFAGTICLSPGTLKQLLKEIVVSLQQQGAEHIVLMSGHNGNYPVLKELARELLDEYGWRNLWHFPLEYPKEVLARAASPAPAGAAHAGELETAMLLYLRPELVRMEKAAKEFPVLPEDYAYRPIHWKEFMHSGSFGDGSAATADYGKALVEGAAALMADRIERLVR